MQDLLDLADTWSEIPISYPWRRRTPTKFVHISIFHNLNKETPNDEYPMPIDDMLINSASGH
jgi:hypothetical protein